MRLPIRAFENGERSRLGPRPLGGDGEGATRLRAPSGVPRVRRARRNSARQDLVTLQRDIVATLRAELAGTEPHTDAAHAA